MKDFNKNLLTGNVDREWLIFTLTLGLIQLASNPTWVTNSTSTLIDHIYTNMDHIYIPIWRIISIKLMFSNQLLVITMPFSEIAK